MEDEYIKAVLLTDAKMVVYACQFTEDKYFFVDGPIVGSKIYLIRIGDDVVCIMPNDWLVWFPDSIEYDLISDDEFRYRFVLYDDCPSNIKAVADTFPSFDEWVELTERGC